MTYRFIFIEEIHKAGLVLNLILKYQKRFIIVKTNGLGDFYLNGLILKSVYHVTN